MVLTTAVSIVLTAVLQSIAIGAIAAVVTLGVTVATGPRYDDALGDERR